MKEELELELVKKYPTFFTDYKGDPRETCMAWGCEHGDGWYNILSDLCAYINATLNYPFRVKAKEGYSGEEVDEYGYITLPAVRFYFQQIKEKFGKLRIYHWVAYDIGDWEQKVDIEDYEKKYDTLYYNPINNAVEYVEYISSKYCEDCGKRGKTYYDGWWKTLCPDCAKEQDRDGDINIKDCP